MAEQFGIRLSVSPVDLAASINNAIRQINSANSFDKVRIGADTSELESAIKRIKSEIASITGRNSTSKIELGTSRADGQVTLEELSALRKAEESLANPVGMAAIQAEFSKTAEIVRNLTSALSTLKTEYLSIGEVKPVGNAGVPIDTNAISKKIKTAVSGLNITKPVEIPIVFKNVQDAVAALQQQVNGTVINFGNSTLNGTGANTGDIVSNAVKQAAEQATEALKQQAQAEKEATNAIRNNSAAIAEQTRAVKENESAYRIRNTVMSSGDTSKAVTYGDSSKNSTYNYKNGEFVSRTDIENLAQQRKEMDRLAATAVDLRGKLDFVKNSYRDLSNSVQINPDNIAKLDREYEELAARIEKLKQSSSQYNAEEIANIKTRTALLKQEAEQYRKANTAGGDLRNKDVPTVASVKAEEFAAFINTVSANRSVFAAVKNDIAELQKAFENIGGDKTRLNDCLNKFDILKAKVKNATAEIKTADIAMKEINDAMKSLDRIANKPIFVKNSGNAEIARLLGAVNELKTSAQELKEKLALDGSSDNVNKTRESMAALKQQIVEAVAQSDKMADNFKRINASDTNNRKVAQYIAQMEEYIRKNSKAMSVINPSTGKTYGEDIRAYITLLQTMGNVGDEELKKIANGFANIRAQIKAANRDGNTFWDELKAKASKFIKWTAMTLVITKARMYFRKLFTTVYELDTALVDLRKTFKSNNEELEAFYFESNKIAKQMCVTTKEIISQASAWSRLGFSTKEQASKMAEYSAMFKGISPGMDMDTATDGLVSVMKAFKIGLDDVDEVVDGIMSKINIVGNTAATSNSETVEMLTRSSAAMAAANNTLEQTIALGTAGVEILRDAGKIGTSLKSISMNIRALDEETGELIGDTEEVFSKIADYTKTASNLTGVSIFTDKTHTVYRSTYDILKDISKVWKEISDTDQAALVKVLGGKYQGNAVSAIIQNFDAAEKAMETMKNSAGSAEAEMEIIRESAEYALNEMKETFTSLAQSTISRDFLKDLINSGTKLIEVFSDAAPVLSPLLSLIGGVTKAAAGLVDTMGLLPAVFAGLSLKNIGGIYCKHAYPCIAA